MNIDERLEALEAKVAKLDRLISHLFKRLPKPAKETDERDPEPEAKAE